MFARLFLSLSLFLSLFLPLSLLLLSISLFFHFKRGALVLLSSVLKCATPLPQLLPNIFTHQQLSRFL